jgi:hypothetical protein
MYNHGYRNPDETERRREIEGLFCGTHIISIEIGGIKVINPRLRGGKA